MHSTQFFLFYLLNLLLFIVWAEVPECCIGALVFDLLLLLLET